MISKSIFFVWLISHFLTFFNVKADTLSASEAYKLIEHMRGEELQLVIPSVSEEIKKRQEDGGCDQMDEAIESIIEHVDSSPWAAQYLALCVNSNMENRDYLANYSDDFHEALVEMLYRDNGSKAAASELIWIASFNHGGHILKFVRADAIEALSEIITSIEYDRDFGPSQMWAAAALQNLAANYCNPYCEYIWRGEPNERKMLVIEESTPVTVEGTAVRKRIFEINGLIMSLGRMACIGPVWDSEEEIAWPGSLDTKWNYPYDIDNSSYSSLVAWAAAGALKNLALLPEARETLEDDNFKVCLCRLAQSEDWLEQLKGNQFFFYLRPDYPCHYYHEENAVCIDWDGFVDVDGYSCSAYEEHECEEYADRVGVLDDDSTVSDACCVCGGGEYSTPDGYYPEQEL